MLADSPLSESNPAFLGRINTIWFLSTASGLIPDQLNRGLLCPPVLIPRASFPYAGHGWPF